MVLNQQSRAQIDLAGARTLVEQLRRILGFGECHFNVCFVEDERIAKLNRTFRRKPDATDVLSFPWLGREASATTERAELAPEFCGFLGDVVISVESARRNAEAEGHALSREIGWLILHGLLHLLGMDHETDQGEMAAIEYALRARLGFCRGARKVAKAQAGEKRGIRPRRSRKPRRLLYRMTAA